MRKERGAAAVETAILSIFLLGLLMGIVDVGRGIFTRIAIEDAAQSGAAYAAFADPVTIADIEDVVLDSAAGSIDLTAAAITVDCDEDTSGDRPVRYVTVDVVLDQDIITPAISIFTDSIRLHASATSERFAEDLPC